MGTIVVLQQQLKEAKDEIAKLNSELGKDTERRSSLEVDKDSLRTETTSDNTEQTAKRKSQGEEANDEIESEHDTIRIKNRIYSIIVVSEKCNLLSTVLRSEKPILIWGIRINKLRLQWTDNKVKSNLHLK